MTCHCFLTESRWVSHCRKSEALRFAREYGELWWIFPASWMPHVSPTKHTSAWNVTLTSKMCDIVPQRIHGLPLPSLESVWYYRVGLFHLIFTQWCSNVGHVFRFAELWMCPFPDGIWHLNQFSPFCEILPCTRWRELCFWDITPCNWLDFKRNTPHYISKHVNLRDGSRTCRAI